MGKDLLNKLLIEKITNNKKRKGFDLPVKMCDEIDNRSKNMKTTKSRLAEIAFSLLFAELDALEKDENKTSE